MEKNQETFKQSRYRFFGIFQIVSIFLIVFIIMQLKRMGTLQIVADESGKSGSIPTLLAIFAFLSILIVPLRNVLYSFLMKLTRKIEDAEMRAHQHFTFSLIVLGILFFPVWMGAVLCYLSGVSDYIIYFAVYSLILHLVFFPRDFETWERTGE